MENQKTLAHVLKSNIMKNSRFSYEDLIFENRNKTYGAYDLRVNYDTNLMRSFFIAIGSLTMIAFLFYWINGLSQTKKPAHKIIEYVVLDKVFEIEKNVMKNIQPVSFPKKAVVATPPTPPVPPVDPLSFKMVSEIIPPATKPIEPPQLVQSIDLPGSIASTGPAGIFTAPISTGTGINSTVTVLSSAVVDKQPVFPGGLDGFYKFLANHIRFPEEAKREGISAKLFVSFVINKEGKLVEIEFVKKAGYGMEESVSAVLEKSPKWIPGQVGQEQVSTRMILPVNFNLVQ